MARDEADLKARRAAWERSQGRTEDVLTACRQVAKDMATISACADQRALCQALKVRVDIEPGGAWKARGDVLPDMAAGESNLYRTSGSSIVSSTPSSSSARRPSSSWPG